MGNGELGHRDPTFKAEVGNVGHLSPTEAQNVVTVQMPGGPNASLAALFAQLAPTVRTPTQVAVQLVAEVLGMQQVVATAALPAGYSGLVAVATGIVADAWHGRAYGVLERGSLDMRLATRPCCSGFRVAVPAILTTRLTPRLKSAVPAPCLPLVRHEGAYECVTLTAPNVVAIAETERVLRVVAISDGNQGGLSGFGSAILHWPPQTEVIFEPRGNVEGPRNLTFTNITYAQVEIVH
jgi:hypothetical protein